MELDLSETHIQQLIISKSVQEGEFRFEMTEGFEVKSIVNQ